MSAEAVMAPATGRSILLDGIEIRSEQVTFDSINADLLKEVGGPEAEPQRACGQLFLPDGEPRNRPAMVIVQGLGGVKPERELTYAAKLARAGCVALVVDSFAARGKADERDILKALSVTTWSILGDAFGALRLLADHPAVNRDAIGVMGFSWGGMVAVLSAYRQVRQTYLGEAPLRFAGHASYYGCSLPRLADPAAPGAQLLVLVGRSDANVSVERTKAICDDLRRGGAQVALEVLDAYHQWDGSDTEKRHVFGALADIGITVTPDNRLVDEHWGAEIAGRFSRTLFMALDLGWDGYDIQRDAELHRRTDGMLFDFVQGMAARAGARPPDAGTVPMAAIGEKPAG